MTVLFADPEIAEPQVTFKLSQNERANELFLLQINTRRSRFVAKAKERRSPEEVSPAARKMDAAIGSGMKSKDRMNVEAHNPSPITNYFRLGFGGHRRASSGPMESGERIISAISRRASSAPLLRQSSCPFHQRLSSVRVGPSQWSKMLKSRTHCSASEMIKVSDPVRLRGD
jgi:hypothetical protein